MYLVLENWIELQPPFQIHRASEARHLILKSGDNYHDLLTILPVLRSLSGSNPGLKLWGSLDSGCLRKQSWDLDPKGWQSTRVIFFGCSRPAGVKFDPIYCSQKLKTLWFLHFWRFSTSRREIVLLSWPTKNHSAVNMISPILLIFSGNLIAGVLKARAIFWDLNSFWLKKTVLSHAFEWLVEIYGPSLVLDPSVETE